MNRKAQNTLTVGGIILAFVGIIVALAIFTGGITGGVGDVTTTGSYNSSNGGVALTPVDNTAQVLPIGKTATNFLAINASDGAVVPAANYTVTSNVVTDGTLGATFTPLTGTTATYPSINVSYDYEPVTYISDAGGRGMVGIILIFCVLAIALVALVPALQGLREFR